MDERMTSMPKTPQKLQDFYQAALKTDSRGNVLEARRRLDSDSFNSDSTFYVDEHNKIKKMTARRELEDDERQTLNVPIDCQSIYSAVSDIGQISASKKDSFTSLVKERKRNFKRFLSDNPEKREIKDKKVDSTLSYDWRTWENQFHNCEEADIKDFYFKIKRKSQDNKPVLLDIPLETRKL